MRRLVRMALPKSLRRLTLYRRYAYSAGYLARYIHIALCREQAERFGEVSPPGGEHVDRRGFHRRY